MFKIAALLASIPLVAAAKSTNHVAQVAMDASKRNKEVVSSIPAKFKAAATATTDDVTDSVRYSNSIWVGTAYFNSWATCDSWSNSGLFSESASDLNIPAGCINLPGDNSVFDDDYDGSLSQNTMCNGTHLWYVRYAGAKCSGAVTESQSYEIGGDCTHSLNGDAYYASACYYNQGNVWTSKAGYTTLTFSTSDCPTGCATPLEYVSSYEGVCVSGPDNNYTLSNCDDTAKTIQIDYYANKECTGMVIASRDSSLDQTTCLTGVNLDDDSYGLGSYESYCTANAPTICGSAMHYGASFGLTGLLVAVSFYFSK